MLDSTWNHVTEADSTESDEGVVDTVEIVPLSRPVILQSREDCGWYQHQHRGEEEDEDDGLHQDHHHPRLLLYVLLLPQTLPQFPLVLFKLQI